MKRMIRSIAGGFFASAALYIDLGAMTEKLSGTAAITYLRTSVFGETLLPCCIFALMFMLIYNAPRRRSGIIAPAVCAVIYTLSSIFAGGNTDISAFTSPVPIAVLLVVLSGAYVFFSCVSAWFSEMCSKAPGTPSSGGRIKYALLIIACWLPYLLIAYPGTLHNDSWDMISQFTGTFSGVGQELSRTVAVSTLRSANVFINDTQPVIYTVVLGSLFTLFSISGHAELSVFVLGLIQLVYAGFTVGRLLELLKRLGLRTATRRLLTTFFALFPLFPMYFACTMKDSFFAMFLLSFMTFAIEVTVFPKETLADKKRTGGGMFAMLMTALSRSFGIFMLILVIPALLIKLHSLDRHVFRRGIAVLLIPVVAFCAVNYALYPLLSIGKGPESESMSMMFQQTALYVKEYPDEVTEEEKAVIGAVLDYDNLAELYMGNNSDNVKYAALFCSGGFSDYRQVWLNMLIRRPGVYARAVFAMGADYWDIRDNAAGNNLCTYIGTDGSISHSEYSELVPIATNKSLLRVCNLVNSAVRAITVLPPVSLLFKSGVYLYALILAAAFMRREKKSGLILIWLLIIYGVCLCFTPIGGSTRYAFPIFLCAPAFICAGTLMPGKKKDP